MLKKSFLQIVKTMFYNKKNKQLKILKIKNIYLNCICISRDLHFIFFNKVNILCIFD